MIQEITIYGTFTDAPEDFLEQLAELIIENFDCELIGMGRVPRPDFTDSVEDDDVPCKWCQEDDCRGGCLL